MNENKKIYVDYEIRGYEISYTEKTYGKERTIYFGTEEKAVEEYRKLLYNPECYGLTLKKVSTACQFYEDNNHVYTFDD